MKKYLIITILGLLTVGCTDLEENPKGIIDPATYYNNTNELQAAVNGSYGLMSAEKYWGRALTLTLILRSDMCDIGNTSTSVERIQVNNFTVNDNNALITSLWQQSYAVIGAANQAIDGSKKLTNGPTVVNPIVAEARFYRAFAYYNLVRMFGSIPYIDYAVSDPKLVESISKTAEAEVYNKIIADLEFAKLWLPNKGAVKAKPGKGTAAAYLSSVYLTLGNFQKAYDESKYVITNEALFGLGLENDFQDLFNSAKALSLKEPLFTIDFTNIELGDQGRDFQGFLTGIDADKTYAWGGGFSVAVPSLKVFETWDQRDYRRAVSFDTVRRATATSPPIPYTAWPKTTNNLPPQRPHIAKYQRFAGPAGLNGRTSSNNYATMRYAEVLLTAAEALNEITPGTAEANGYLNRILTRARNKAGKVVSYPPNVATGLSQADFRKAVLEQRRLELAFEFGRWFDIKRLKSGVEAFSATGFEPQANFNASKHYYFPFPATEIVRNPNLAPNNPF
jgi:hypothetical protein